MNLYNGHTTMARFQRLWALKVNLKQMKGLHMVTFTLLIIGGLNWGLEAFGTGIGHWINSWPVVMLLYILIGLSALFEAFTHKKNCRCCDMKDKVASPSMPMN